VFGQTFMIEKPALGPAAILGIAAAHFGSPPDGYTMAFPRPFGHLLPSTSFSTPRCHTIRSATSSRAEPDLGIAERLLRLPPNIVRQDGGGIHHVGEAERQNQFRQSLASAPSAASVGCGLFVQRTGLDAVHVPFRGAAQTIPAILSGDVNFAIDNLASYVPFFQSGKMRALALTSAQRWPTMPDVPTMARKRA